MPTNLLDQYGPNGAGTVKGLDNATIGGYGGSAVLNNTYKPADSYQTNVDNQTLPKFSGDNTYSATSAVAPNGGINQGHY